jgi:hypothetical protein
MGGIGSQGEYYYIPSKRPTLKAPENVLGKDRTIRIRVSGDYKLTTAPLTTGPDGLAGENPEKDLLPNVPFGAVMGAIIPAATPGTTEAPEEPPFSIAATFVRSSPARVLPGR